ncbi:protein of unknown function [Xenorhabdus nematophila AN6/1]|nr:protein of unknown function [Xenorhabdus nematophila AN6/1]
MIIDATLLEGIDFCKGLLNSMMFGIPILAKKPLHRVIIPRTILSDPNKNKLSNLSFV